MGQGRKWCKDDDVFFEGGYIDVILDVDIIMDKKVLYEIDRDIYLKPDRKRPSGTHASTGWDSRNQFESFW